MGKHDETGRILTRTVMSPPPPNKELYPIEPQHSPLLSTIQARQPFNAEPPVAELVEFNVTPEQLVYARNHGPVRDFDEQSYQLTLRLQDGRRFNWSLESLKTTFEKFEIVAVLQCAGNRRTEMAVSTGKKVNGVPWDDAVLANCSWAGLRVKDLLESVGISSDDGLHVQFASYATLCEDDDYYGASIPLAKAMNTEDEVMIAWEMNGAPLSAAHGGPLRVVVPGYLGARWVKWVDTVAVASLETQNFYMQRDYKLLPPEIDTKAQATDVWAKYPAMTMLPLNSVVATVIPISDSLLFVKGYAVPAFSDPYVEGGASNNIARVEVSLDDGKRWHSTRIVYQEGKWSWTVWECELELCSQQGSVEVCCRAIDANGNVQPKEVAWNLRGVAWNSWGRKKIDI